MIVFWIAAAAMIVVALGFIVLPLGGWFRRGEADGSGRSGIVLAVATFPVVAVATYLWLGSLDAVEATPAPAVASAGNAHAEATPHAAPDEGEMHAVDDMASRLEERLRAEPKDAEGWILLGRTYGYMKRPAESVRAFSEARKLKGDDPRLLADLAEAMAQANGNRIAGEPAKLIAAVLAKEPDNTKALWLAGVDRLQHGDREEAARLWKKLRGLLPAGSREAAAIDGYLAQIDAADTGPAARTAKDVAGPPATGGRPSIRVKVAVDPAVAVRASPDDTVYVFARAAQGPRMPVAIVRAKVRELPFEVELDESRAMAGGPSLASQHEVYVGARISRSGEAMARAGDLEGVAGPVPVATKTPVEVRIARVIP